MNPNHQPLIDLITGKKASLMSYPYKDLDPAAKDALVKWLGSENFPTDKPTDLVGDDYVIAWFSDNSKLLIFSLSYEEEEQCGGTIIFESDGKTCKYMADTVECSS